MGMSSEAEGYVVPFGTTSTAVAASMTPVSKPHIPDHELFHLIGRGSYGEVWLARNIVATFRAVKIVYRSSFDRDRPYEREFAGIQKFEPISRSHEGLVDILQVGRNEAESYFYYVMELADSVSPVPDSQREVSSSLIGDDVQPETRDPKVETYVPRTLRHDLEQRSRLPLSKCIDLGLAMTSALAHLHKQGLVHRDVKPS